MTLTRIKPYVEEIEGALRVAGTRVSLDSIVCAYQEGESPQRIVEDFPSLSLEQVYGAIGFYLPNQQEVDAYLEEGERRYHDESRLQWAREPELLARLRAARIGLDG